MDFKKLINGAKNRDLKPEEYQKMIDNHYKSEGCSLSRPLECVYPSKKPSVFACVDLLDKSEINNYNSIHRYNFKNNLGSENGVPNYGVTEQSIQFCKVTDDGIINGIQDEQLLIAMIDRQEKLSKRFPSDNADKKLKGLKMALEAYEDRLVEVFED